MDIFVAIIFIVDSLSGQPVDMAVGAFETEHDCLQSIQQVQIAASEFLEFDAAGSCYSLTVK